MTIAIARSPVDSEMNFPVYGYNTGACPYCVTKHQSCSYGLYIERYCLVLWYFLTFLSVLYVYTVHGFASVSYTVVEAGQLTTTFGPNVKGNSPLGRDIGGQIIAEAVTARMFLLLICTFDLDSTPIKS